METNGPFCFEVVAPGTFSRECTTVIESIIERSHKKEGRGKEP